MGRAVIYCRVSTRDQVEGTSLTTQEKDCRALCDAEGHTVVDVVYDVGERDDLDGRVGMTRVRSMFREGEVDVLVVWMYSRLSGDPVQQSVIIYEIETKAGGTIRSTREKFEDGPTGGLLRYITAFGNQMEVNAIRERQRRQRQERLERGELPPHPVPPYGYTWADPRHTQYQIKPEEVAVVRRAIDLLLAGISSGEVARRFNAEGLVTRTGGPWKAKTIQDLTRNTVYYGQVLVSKRHYAEQVVTDPTTGEARKVLRHVVHTEPIELGTCPAIITRQEWETARANLQNRAAGRVRGNLAESFLLRGSFAYCGHCGSQLIARSNREIGLAYFCPPRDGKPGLSYPAAHLDTTVWRIVSEWVKDPDILSRAVARRIENSVQPNDLTIQSLGHVIEATETKARSLFSAISGLGGEDDENLSEMVALHKDLKMRARAARGELEALLEQRRTWEELNRGLEETLQWCQGAVSREDLSFADKRRVLYLLGFRITLWRRGSPEGRWKAEIGGITSLKSTNAPPRPPARALSNVLPAELCFIYQDTDSFWQEAQHGV